MFFQVKVPKKNQNFLRFLWWPNVDSTKEPQEYCIVKECKNAILNVKIYRWKFKIRRY